MTDINLKQIETNVFVSLENLQDFYKTLETQLATKKFNASQIIETETKKFISQVLLNKLENDVYTKNEVFTKIETTSQIEEVKALVSGITFKGVYNTIAELPSVAQDGWLAIVTNDPSLEGVNHLYIYETAKLSRGQWIKLEEIMVPGLATAEKDGLLSKEDKIKINEFQSKIDTLKSELISKITNDITIAKQDVTTAYKEADKVIDNKIIRVETDYKEADVQINAKITEVEGAYKEADKVVEQKITELENKIQFATKSQIEAIFTAPKV